MTARAYDAAFIKNAGGRSASVVLLELRERHERYVATIKTNLKPGDPKRHAALKVADAAAQAIFAAEREAKGK